jgi:hypothetical protein
LMVDAKWNDEARMTNDEIITNIRTNVQSSNNFVLAFGFCHSFGLRHLSFVICES